MKLKLFCEEGADELPVDDVLVRIGEATAMEPFSDESVRFVADFAMAVLLHPGSRQFPELVVLGNFFKKAKIDALKQEFLNRGAGLVLPRGFIFHIAPSNVDSVFLYSSLLSLLCGNVNLIRISRSISPQLEFVFSILEKMSSGVHKSVIRRLIVVTYEHNDLVTSKISGQCQMRVVWGGDSTVSRIRAIPLRPTATELCFADRFSVAMFDATHILAVEEAQLARLSSAFFKDTIWFAQQACSSPRLVAWIGSDDIVGLARRRFWSAFEFCAERESSHNDGGATMDRFVAACLVATNPVHRETACIGFPTRILLESSSIDAVKSSHCGNGMFYEQIHPSIEAFFKLLSDREQTLAVHGFSRDDILRALPNLPLRAIDRIVPVGKALDFHHVWDGHDLLSAFTRKITYFE